MTPYLVCVWLHIVAAAVWVGSMVFFAAAVVPVLRRAELREQAPALLRLVGLRFRAVGLVSLLVLVVTGIGNLHFRTLDWAELGSGGFWASAYGRVLAWKLGLVVVVSALTGAHDRLSGDRRVASWLGRVILLASLAILFLAVALVRGGLG